MYMYLLTFNNKGQIRRVLHREKTMIVTTSMHSSFRSYTALLAIANIISVFFFLTGSLNLFSIHCDTVVLLVLERLTINIMDRSYDIHVSYAINAIQLRLPV